MIRIFLLLIIGIAAITAKPVQAGDSGAISLQREWMINLVDALGLSYGLPDEPEDADYLAILEGRRHLRVEAESALQPTDMVSVKNYDSFGEFSGKGWVSGVAKPTVVNLRFNLPLAGTYHLTAALRLEGSRIELAGKTFAPGGGLNFAPVYLGAVELPPGEHVARIDLPPNGAIDYLELSAPNLRPIAPLNGWQPDRALSAEDMAVTAVRALGLEAALPPRNNISRVEAESAEVPEGAETTDIQLLGAPSGGRWIRAGNREAEMLIPFSVRERGVYRLLVRGTAEKPISARLDDHLELPLAFTPHLSDTEAGFVYLDRGQHRLQLNLPPRAGVDALVLEPHSATGNDYQRLAGVSGQKGAPSPQQMNHLLSLLATLGRSH